MTIGAMLASIAVAAGVLVLLGVGVLTTVVGVGLICAGLSKVVA